MPERVTAIARIACLGLLVLVAYQVYGLVTERDPFEEEPGWGAGATGTAAGTGTTAGTGTATGTGTGAAPGAPAATAAAPQPAVPLPERYQAIPGSGLLGPLPQPPPPPALKGIAGKYAIIRAPSGQEDQVAEGGELGGVKVIRIDMNRVLIEYEGKEMELTIFSGLGSPPLAPPAKKESQRR